MGVGARITPLAVGANPWLVASAPLLLLASQEATDCQKAVQHI
jgi:hypothetical protein